MRAHDILHEYVRNRKNNVLFSMIFELAALTYALFFVIFFCSLLPEFCFIVVIVLVVFAALA